MEIVIWHAGCTYKSDVKKGICPKCGRVPDNGGWRSEAMANYRFGMWMGMAALAVAGVTGCATKNYVKTQTAPLVEHTDQLDAKTSANNQQIHKVDDNAQSGIKQ